MIRSDRRRDAAAACPVCEQHGVRDVERPVRIGPAMLVAGAVRAAVAIGSAAASARLLRDPIDLEPRILRRA